MDGKKSTDLWFWTARCCIYVHRYGEHSVSPLQIHQSGIRKWSCAKQCVSPISAAQTTPVHGRTCSFPTKLAETACLLVIVHPCAKWWSGEHQQCTWCKTKSSRLLPLTRDPVPNLHTLILSEPPSPSLSLVYQVPHQVALSLRFLDQSWYTMTTADWKHHKRATVFASRLGIKVWHLLKLHTSSSRCDQLQSPRVAVTSGFVSEQVDIAVTWDPTFLGWSVAW